MDPRLDRLFSSLEAQFGAAIARAEEEAADDLALSLRQDTDLSTLLLTGSWVVSTNSTWEVVREVAKDHVRTNGGRLIPFAVARFRRVDGRRPLSSDATFLEILRAQVRREDEITLELVDETATGRPIACGETHILLASHEQEYLLPLGQISCVRLSRGDSADAS